MLHEIISAFDAIKPLQTASAHCDIPCKIYDPISAQIAALTVIRMVDLLNETAAKDQLSVADHAQITRLTIEKETHAEKVKHEVRVIWGDYFKAPQFEKFPNTNELVHNIMMQGSKCKQHVDRAMAETLLAQVNEFAASFWASKGVETFTATSPYPPSEDVVYPKIG